MNRGFKRPCTGTDRAGTSNLAVGNSFFFALQILSSQVLHFEGNVQASFFVVPDNKKNNTILTGQCFLKTVKLSCTAVTDN